MAKKAKKETDEEFKYLVRVAGTDIDGNRKVPVGLSLIKGIGIRTGEILCNISGVDRNLKIGFITDKDAEELDKLVTNFQNENLPEWLFNRRDDYETGKNRHVISSDLAISLREDINRLRKIRCYKGIRHETGLPVRGQRTRTSFRGSATVGVSRKKVPQK